MQNTNGYKDLSRGQAMVDVAEAELLQPNEALLNRYRPLSTLGVGGNGTVFLAWDEQLTRKVAIKEIIIEDSLDSAIAKNALEEARAAAMLSHTNIVTVHDFISLNGSAYIIMEYIEGLSLSELSEHELSFNEIAHIVKSLSSALSYGHKNGVLHLDIKPGNVIINPEGYVKLIDFGVARLSSALAHESAIGGTLGYMPLEQMEGKPVSKMTDEWAFAALVYELIFNEIPYENKMRFADLSELIELQRFSDPELLESGNEAIDRSLERALHVEPAYRFGSIKSFSDEILAGLGKPSDGKKELSALVTNELDDSDILDRKSDITNERELRTRETIAVWPLIWRGALGLSGFLVSLRFLHFHGLNDSEIASTLGIVALSIILAAAPVLGSALFFAATSVMLLIAGQPLEALNIGLLGALWWLFVGRKSNVISILGLFFLFVYVEANYQFAAILRSTWPTIFPHNFYIVNLIWLGSFILLNTFAYWYYARKG